MNERDHTLLVQMLEYCGKIEERISEFDIDQDSFVGNTAFADMLLMPVFQIGELATGLSSDFCESNRQIPWHAIKGFRNIIAHDYGVVDLDWAWNTVQSDIPILMQFLESTVES